MSEDKKVIRLVVNQEYVFTKSDRAWFMICGLVSVALICSVIINIGDAWTISRMKDHIERLTHELKTCR